MTLYYTITYKDADNIRTTKYFRTKELRNRFVLRNQVFIRGEEYGSEEM